MAFENSCRFGDGDERRGWVKHKPLRLQEARVFKTRADRSQDLAVPCLRAPGRTLLLLRSRHTADVGEER